MTAVTTNAAHSAQARNQSINLILFGHVLLVVQLACAVVPVRELVRLAACCNVQAYASTGGSNDRIQKSDNAQKAI
jgi:hypothetical protein